MGHQSVEKTCALAFIHVCYPLKVQWAQVEDFPAIYRMAPDQRMYDRGKRGEMAFTFVPHLQSRIAPELGIEQRGTETVFHLKVFNSLFHVGCQYIVGGNGINPGCFAAGRWRFHGTQHRTMIGVAGKYKIRMPWDKTHESMIRFGIPVIDA